MPKFNYLKYGDIKNFKEIGRHPIIDSILVGTRTVQEQTGEYIAYTSHLPPKCKIDVLIPKQPNSEVALKTTKQEETK